MDFFTLGCSKSHIMITGNDHGNYEMHILGNFLCFPPYWGVSSLGGRAEAPKGLVHHHPMHLFTLLSSNIEVPETRVF